MTIALRSRKGPMQHSRIFNNVSLFLSSYNFVQWTARSFFQNAKICNEQVKTIWFISKLFSKPTWNVNCLDTVDNDCPQAGRIGGMARGLRTSLFHREPMKTNYQLRGTLIAGQRWKASMILDRDEWGATDYFTAFISSVSMKLPW